MTTDESTTNARGRRMKVPRILEEYDLTGLGAELEALWTAEEDRRSLRELAKQVNLEVLRSRLDSTGIETLDGEVENFYRLLTDEEVSSADRTRVRRRLEREGLDVESMRGDFVTYQAVRTYLTEHRGVEFARDERDPIERETENVERLLGRIETVTQGKLEQLRDRGHISTGTLRTMVDVQVVCEDCNSQYGVVELLENGECDCSPRE